MKFKDLFKEDPRFKEYWKRLNIFKKIIFILGWAAGGPRGLIEFGAMENEDNIWNPKAWKIIYIRGWVLLIVLLFVIIFGQLIFKFLAKLILNIRN